MAYKMIEFKIGGIFLATTNVRCIVHSRWGWCGLSSVCPCNGAINLTGGIGCIEYQDSFESDNPVVISSLHKLPMYIISELKICNLKMDIRPWINGVVLLITFWLWICMISLLGLVVVDTAS